MASASTGCPFCNFFLDCIEKHCQANFTQAPYYDEDLSMEVRRLCENDSRVELRLFVEGQKTDRMTVNMRLCSTFGESSVLIFEPSRLC
jgi:hypothetical protein